MISTILYPIFGGIIGYLTNDIAIRMLFRPHTAKYILNFHIPFTPGIIPKEKERIASAIGNTISENLMNSEVLEKYLISEEMLGQIRNAIIGFIDKQKTNKETLFSFLCHYLSEEELKSIVNSISNNISEQTSSKLADPIVGETVAKLTMDYISKKLNGDGARILLTSIGGIAKGIGGVAASLLGVDVVAKFMELLREPTERYLANNINTMLQENGAQIVADMLGSETNSFLDKRIDSLLEGHEQQLDQLPDTMLSIYQTVIKEHLPRILESIDISRIVTERIKEMNMNEFEPIILSVISKELKAIVWLGGALGAMIGCINIFI